MDSIGGLTVGYDWTGPSIVVWLSTFISSVGSLANLVCLQLELNKYIIIVATWNISLSSGRNLEWWSLGICSYRNNTAVIFLVEKINQYRSLIDGWSVMVSSSNIRGTYSFVALLRSLHKARVPRTYPKFTTHSLLPRYGGGKTISGNAGGNHFSRLWIERYILSLVWWERWGTYIYGVTMDAMGAGYDGFTGLSKLTFAMLMDHSRCLPPRLASPEYFWV